jgi:hypothetical protein
VLQEAHAEAGAVGGAFDDAGDVRDHERAIDAARHDAQVWNQCGERVVGDLGPSLRDGRNERALAGVRKAHDADVGEQLELEAQLLVIAGPSVLGPARRALAAAREVHVAAPAAPALRDHEGLFGRVEVDQQLAALGVVDLRAHRDAQHALLAGLAVLVAAAPVLARLGLDYARVGEVEQRGQLRVGAQDYIAASTAVAPGGAAERAVLLAPHGDGAVAAIACMHLDRHFVDELHGRLPTLVAHARQGVAPLSQCLAPIR